MILFISGTVQSNSKEPAQNGFSSIQHFNSKANHRLQSIRSKQESEEQKHEPAQQCRREKESDPEESDNDRGNRQEERAKVKEASAQGNQQSVNKGNGCDDYSQCHLHSKRPPYLSTYILPCLRVNINVMKE